MFNHVGLIHKTTQYKIIKNEKEKGLLSHAYLLLSRDKKYLREYLKTFAKLIMCKNDGKDDCRICRLIESENLIDVKFYPEKDEKGILKEHIASLVEESVVKPYEADKKLFVLCNAEEMNAVAQNKLLKTLEEPPANVFILLGATNETALLPTIISRVKKLEIPPFNEEDILNALTNDCPDRERLLSAVKRGDGTVSRAEELYFDKNGDGLKDFVIKALRDFKSSRDIVPYESMASKFDEMELIELLESVFNDILYYNNGLFDLIKNKDIIDAIKEEIKNYKDGVLVYLLDCLQDAKKRKRFNANSSMLINHILFKILEGKYKWQKL